jgi:hypothetical protein
VRFFKIFYLNFVHFFKVFNPEFMRFFNIFKIRAQMPRPSRISHFASAQSPQRTNSALPGFRFGCLKQPSRVLNSPAQFSSTQKVFRVL